MPSDLLEIRCARCRSVLRTVTEDEVPDPLEGWIRWHRCRCSLPKVAGSPERVRTAGRAGNLTVRAPWQDFRQAVARARATGRRQVVTVGSPRLR